MRIRQTALGVMVAALVGPLNAQSAGAAASPSVITLPGVHASANAAGCAEADGIQPAALSYECLNRAVAPAANAAMPISLDAGVRDRPTNRLGLYNAAALGHRMGPNLGSSVQPYRPRLSYPTPLVPAH
ncbi:hypothetical protein J2X57_003944 [Luteibacter sp. 1214]|uniref:hypothetical protein n=1 Tax=Luteibacter sp. 1214 TaxID=2817735 RepID=UPI002866E057|nr:hypothetical protein [Luteibacter sp. 1214]MDR6644701.1 hypothetical protein [Luteibacter sp. 1214]